MPETAKDLVRTIFAKLDESQSGEPFRTFGADDYVAHIPGMPDLDREGMVQFGSAFFGAFHGLHHNIRDIVEEDGRVAVRLFITGKHDGTLVMPSGEVPPTGREIALDVQNFIHVKDGKVSEHWLVIDMALMMQQIGAMG